jgi:hypothetical protein
MSNSDQASAGHRIPTIRLSPSSSQVQANLGLLADLVGTWHGKGFNLVARPNKQDAANLYLELNQTEETLKFDPIATSIPNRGFGQDDIELFGLTYLQKISDAVTGGALHIEPGIWITQPGTSAPPENAPPGGQIIARMGSIPHGNSILAEGAATTFSGSPVLAANAIPYNGSLFPSFNSTPFPVGGAIFAPNSSELGSAPPGTNGGFSQYTLTNPASATNPRTPFGNTPATELPAEIEGVLIQDLLNDPIRLLQAVVARQVNDGFEFAGTVLNIASQTPILFGTTPDQAEPTVSVSVPLGGGDIGNIPFLNTNASSALVYATFWIERLSHLNREHAFLQLQYAQMVLLNFPILLAPAPQPNLSWPHISVATLHKVFG